MFSWHLPSCLTPTVFSPLFGRVHQTLRWRTWWRPPIYTPRAYLAVAAFCFYLLPEETSLIMTGQGIDLWIQENIIRNHFCFFFVCCFASGVRFCLRYPVPGHPSSVGHVLTLVSGASNWTSDWFTAPKSSDSITSIITSFHYTLIDSWKFPLD